MHHSLQNSETPESLRDKEPSQVCNRCRDSKLVISLPGQRSAKHVSSLLQARHILSIYRAKELAHVSWCLNHNKTASKHPRKVLMQVLKKNILNGRDDVVCPDPRLALWFHKKLGQARLSEKCVSSFAESRRAPDAGALPVSNSNPI